MMRRANRVVAAFLLISLLAIPVAANAWIEIYFTSSASQNIPGDPDTPTDCTYDNDRDFAESFNGDGPDLSFVTIMESALFAVFQTPCVGL